MFQDHHIEQIRTGEKTATRRDWKRSQVKEGGVYMATPIEMGLFAGHDDCDCYIRVGSVYEQPLGEMIEEDAKKEGGYTLEEFEQAWREINGEDSWDPEKEVTVVEFEYVGRDLLA